VAETTVKRFHFCGFRRTGRDGTSVSSTNTQRQIETNKDARTVIKFKSLKAPANMGRGERRYTRTFIILIIAVIIIQFNSLLFMCRANSHKANYRHSSVCIKIIVL
jgi:hypothetical protein